jgi:hypothetical protein
MIKIQDSVPGIYYNSSRDFQYIGHLFDLVLNAVKTDADLLFNLPLSVNSDDQLLDLMTYTFGLRLDKARYNSKQLRAICSVAPQMLRAKGSSKAVRLLCTALMHADGLEDYFTITVNPDRPELTITLSSLASCKEIILELLPYILPAGMVFNIISTSTADFKAQTRVVLQDEVIINSAIPGTTLPAKSDISNKSLQSSGSINKVDNQLELKPGLASNTILEKPLGIKIEEETEEGVDNNI